MSFEGQESPYNSPTVPPAGGFDSPPGSQVPKKPGGLVAVATLLLIFGILGCIIGCMNIGVTAFSEQVTGIFNNILEDSGEVDEEAKRSLEQVKSTFEAQSKYRLPLLLAYGFGFLVSLGMAIAGVMGFTGALSGRTWMIGSSGLAAVSRVIDGIMVIVITMSASQIAQEKLGEGGAVAAGGVAEMVGLVIQLLMSGAICVGYIAMMLYVMKSKKVHEYYAYQASSKGR